MVSLQKNVLLYFLFYSQKIGLIQSSDYFLLGKMIEIKKTKNSQENDDVNLAITMQRRGVRLQIKSTEIESFKFRFNSL